MWVRRRRESEWAKTVESFANRHSPERPHIDREDSEAGSLTGSPVASVLSRGSVNFVHVMRS